MEKESLAIELVLRFEQTTVYDKDCKYNDDEQIDSINFKLVWFSKTLQNWKALVADISPGGKFYEVTYNGDKEEAYIDVYRKVYNSSVKIDI